MDVIDLFERGGPLMWAILACSVVAVAVFFERLWALRRGRVVPAGLRDSVLGHLRAEDTGRTAQLCRENRSSLSRVVEAALRHRHASRSVAKEAMEESGRVEVSSLEAGLGALSTIAAIAPLLGLLGTVAGMITVFQDVAGTQNPDISILARGIWEALLTTGAGLTIAIPTYVAHRFLESRVDRHSRDLEEASLEVLELLFPGDTAARGGTGAPESATEPAGVPADEAAPAPQEGAGS